MVSLKRPEDKAADRPEDQAALALKHWPKPTCKECNGPGEVAHICPYAEEIYEDTNTLCTCCDNCAHECAMDI